MRDVLITLGIGFVSGVLSGAFGIGGGIITTPAIKLILGAPALVAVGTPLPVIFPSALTGSISYARNGIADMRAGVICGIAGSTTAVIGAMATKLVGGNVVLLATAALILYTAVDMILQVVRPPRLGLEGSEEAVAFAPPEGVGAPEPAELAEKDEPGSLREADSAPRSVRAEPGSEGAPNRPPHRTLKLVLIGALTGLYSGFLGLGGGFVLVPMLTRWLGYDIKRAIATSLVAITLLAIPGTITHALLGHIDWRIAALLAIGVVPGAIVGARFTMGSAERTVRLSFAALLVAVGVWLAVSTLMAGTS